MREFTRTIIVNEVTPCIVEFENGMVKTRDLDPIIIYGNLTDEKALKEVRKIDKKAVVREIITEKRTYAMSISDFIKNAYEKN